MTEQLRKHLQITIYTTSWCPYCRLARRYLASRRLPYVEIDVEADPAAARRVERWNGGDRTVPTWDVDGRILTNPSADELDILFGFVDYEIVRAR
ncbi:MAG: glutaredoxin family protein [Chloroflexi bacterium]|nr:glutaredoxin family protein [Chloroflexota bacterium]